ncbi:thiaminase II [Streptococcus moroccensis]|uniref:Aminopyrimidine aminohydrolase n=1 Tax=Streptococcus moroccensis TaxID=1451356 RepID=A0ABT9YTQ3_9STRE|nr:thiaminase II [Streptococcus moroccensis]MDQ0223377.1 thiaminase/transcriptional activator TenA [Streptococcus moroccensis]
MRFSTLARKRANRYWEESFHHPFIKELQAGTLSSEIFRYYLLQDRYYLEHFSKIYQIIAERTDNPVIKELMAENSRHLAEGEAMIREAFFKDLGITDEEVAETPIAPTADHYVAHMYRQLAEGSLAVACASLLPCPWLYHEIGLLLKPEGSPVPIYQQFIDTYAGEDSKENIAYECQVLDQLYEKASPEEQEAMLAAFYRSSQLEYLFWEMAYTLEQWPLENEFFDDK